MELSSGNIRNLLSTLKANNYVVYDKPYQLNIVGRRNKTTVPNSFDDTIYVFWKNDKGTWEGKYYDATTDPGTYYLTDPTSKFGTAILKKGQYINAYQIGKHKGQYEALTQQKPVTVIRDYDRNDVLDFNNGKESTGIFGINIHKAGKKSEAVDNWSAGCQVFQKSDDFNEFMKLAKKHSDLYGNNFTYTLIDDRAYSRAVLRRTILITSLVAFIFFGYRAIK